MKLRIAGLFSLLIGFSFFVIGCPSKNSPSTPAAPTPTNTVCTDNAGHTCTPSFTATPSDTATVTPTATPTSSPTATFSRTPTATTTNTVTSTSTGTPSNTRTDTATATITNTLTNTGTPTQTGTPTNSATNTLTATITNTSTDTGTPTQTGTPTNTVPSTPTATATNSPTSTVTQTYTPTPDCTGTYSISGAITYTGPTSGGSGLSVLTATDLGGGNSCNPATEGFSGTTGSYHLGSLPAGSYYVIGLYGPPAVGGAPPLGTYVVAYKSGTTTCTINGSDTISDTSNPTGINITFSNTYTLNGVNALVTYTGSQSGKSLNVGIFNSGYSTEITGHGGFTSGSTTTLIDQTNTCSTGATAYVMAWYGNDNNGPQTGDAYAQTTATETNTSTTNATITYWDTNIW